MPQIVGGQVMPGAVRVLSVAGAPGNGTNTVQTVTLGGTPSGGTFALTCEGMTTAAITWSATNATLLANVDAALEALPTVGTGGVACAATTLTAGIGAFTVTFSGANVGVRPIAVMTVANNSLTGTSPTVAVALTTPGVEATYRGAATGQLVRREDTGVLYYNSSTTAQVPTWVAV
jgi:hypothetical protein